MDLQNLTGVLLLQKSYGRDEKNRLLYRCIPYDKDLSTLLVPYDVKIGFQKSVVNKYVLFSLVGWRNDTESSRIPMGVLRQVLGDVNNLTAYYDYLLYSVGMFRNTGWAKKSVDLKVLHFEQDSLGLDNEPVFTIDNEGTVDFDDAFRFQVFQDGTCCVSVYITDVASLVFNGMGIDYSVDDVLSGVSTLYMPHRRIPMLLDQISKRVRLVAGSLRNCVAVRFFYEFETGRFLRRHCDKKVGVLVERNWNYLEIDSEGENNDLFRFTKLLCDGCCCAKQMVAYWMIQYNRFITGGFSEACFRRKHKVSGDLMSRILEQQEYSLFGSGEKMVFCYKKDENDEDWICPMTNPIRRQADLYNQAIFLQIVRLGMDEGKAISCVINCQMKSVAKIQRETQLLHYMENRKIVEADGVVYRIEPGIKNNRCFVYLDLGKNMGLFSSYKVMDTMVDTMMDTMVDTMMDTMVDTMMDTGCGSLPFRGRFRLFYFCKNHDLKKKICVSPI